MSKVIMLQPSQMTKTTVKMDKSGNIIDTTVVKPGENRFDAIKEARKKRLGI